MVSFLSVLSVIEVSMWFFVQTIEIGAAMRPDLYPEVPYPDKGSTAPSAK